MNQTRYLNDMSEEECLLERTYQYYNYSVGTSITIKKDDGKEIKSVIWEEEKFCLFVRSELMESHPQEPSHSVSVVKNDVKLYVDGKLIKTIPIDFLLATSYIKNPDECVKVNHIDSDKSNNKLSNLEWVN